MRMMLALYMLVRAAKIKLDIKESTGDITREKLDNWILVLGGVMSITFCSLYLMEHEIWDQSNWQSLHWIFGFTNQPNDKIFRDVIRQKTKL